MIPAHVEDAIREAVRLLRESGRHFKSRHVAEARRLLEQALQLEESDHAPTAEPQTHDPSQKR